jgi:hypothetical protein
MELRPTLRPDDQVYYGIKGSVNQHVTVTCVKYTIYNLPLVLVRGELYEDKSGGAKLKRKRLLVREATLFRYWSM